MMTTTMQSWSLEFDVSRRFQMFPNVSKEFLGIAIHLTDVLGDGFSVCGHGEVLQTLCRETQEVMIHGYGGQQRIRR